MGAFRRAPRQGNEFAHPLYRFKRAIKGSELQKNAEKLRKQVALDYGRPDVPSVVRRAVRAYAAEHQISLRVALDILIGEASSFEALTDKCRQAEREIVKQSKRQQKRIHSRPTGPKGWIYRVRLVQGGAPGLGGIRKAIKIKSA